MLHEAVAGGQKRGGASPRAREFAGVLLSVPTCRDLSVPPATCVWLHVLVEVADPSASVLGSPFQVLSSHHRPGKAAAWSA